MKFFKVNPLNWFRGMIEFPIGFYSFEKCECRTCKGENGGWGFLFLFFGFKVNQM